MIRSNQLFVLSLLVSLYSFAEAKSDEMILAVGASGQEEYAQVFGEWATNWRAAAKKSQIDIVKLIGSDKSDSSDYEQLKQGIEQHSKQTESRLWIVLLGHGTFDRGTAKFNLRGKDVEAKELQDWLVDCQRPLVIVNGFSCSGAFLQPLKGENRVVITATKNGSELNFSRFGGHMAEALVAMEADLDHDDQVSLLESFLFATSKVRSFYESDARLVTEHALLEDNQDGKGITADFFRGIRTRTHAKDGSALDGPAAHRVILVSSDQAIQLSDANLKKRDQVENRIETLRAQKAKLATDEYYSQLEKLMVEMAELYRQE